MALIRLLHVAGRLQVATIASVGSVARRWWGVASRLSPSVESFIWAAADTTYSLSLASGFDCDTPHP
jgi:hypothetical protein